MRSRVWRHVVFVPAAALVAALIALGAQPAQAAPSGAPSTPSAFVHEMDGTMHPVDANGFVTDGTPQLDAAHCIGTNAQRWACLVALDPGLPEFLEARFATPNTHCGMAVEQWRPEMDRYPWPVATMLIIMCRESGGVAWIWNARHSGACGLMQLLTCPAGGLDGDTNIRDAYFDKYLPACKRGDCLSPWGE